MTSGILSILRVYREAYWGLCSLCRAPSKAPAGRPPPVPQGCRYRKAGDGNHLWQPQLSPSLKGGFAFRSCFILAPSLAPDLGVEAGGWSWGRGRAARRHDGADGTGEGHKWLLTSGEVFPPLLGMD